MRWELEELAREALEEADVSPPIDPDRLARGLQLAVRDGGVGCESCLIGKKIIVDDSKRPQKRAFDIGHEVGHYLRRRAGLETAEEPDEHAANYLSAALLLPRPEFEALLRRYGWDLLRLRAANPFASFEAIARRIVALRDARAHVFDRPLRPGARPNRYSVPWGLEPTAEERLAAREAIQSGAPVEIRSGLTGWPVIEHDWLRAIVLTAL